MKIYFVRDYASGRPVSPFFDSQEKAELAVPLWSKGKSLLSYLIANKQYMPDVVSLYGDHKLVYEVVQAELR